MEQTLNDCVKIQAESAGELSGERRSFWKQYHEIKAIHPDVILMFRAGDFYEVFGDDAKRVGLSLQLEITRYDSDGEHRIPMCRVPFNGAERQVTQLIEKGYRVAVLDQVDRAGKD